MSLHITDDRMTSDETPEIATALTVPAAADDICDLWTVSWLPGREFDRNAAITAMTIAELLAGGAAPGHPRWPVVEDFAGWLAITPTDVLKWYTARGTWRRTLTPGTTIELQTLAAPTGARILGPLTYDPEDGWITILEGTRYWSRHWPMLCDGLRRAGYAVLSPEPPRPGAARTPLAPALPADVRAALDRLIAIAKVPTGQGGRVANFLLSWWNATDAGGFDLTDLWGLDLDIRPDLVRVFAHVAAEQHYPDFYGYKAAFDELWQRWRGAADDANAPADAATRPAE